MSENILDRAKARADSDRVAQVLDSATASALPVPSETGAVQPLRTNRTRTGLFLLLPVVLLGVGRAYLAGGHYIYRNFQEYRMLCAQCRGRQLR